MRAFLVCLDFCFKFASKQSPRNRRRVFSRGLSICGRAVVRQLILRRLKPPCAPMGAVTSSLSSSLGLAHYVAHVKTGDRKGAGTDANVWLVLHDEHGNASKETKLNSTFHNDHERGQMSSYGIMNANHLGRIAKVEFWRDSFGIGDSWYLDIIQVENRKTGELHHFPVHRWIQPDLKYLFPEYDACLPQFDIHREQRDEELKAKRPQYQYILNIEDGPCQVKCLPEDETFSDSYKWDIGSQKIKLLAHSTWIKFQTEAAWESMDALKTVYRYALGEPHCLPHWKEDWWFGTQRLQGCNAVIIQLCNEIPEKFGVTNEMVQPFLEGMTLKEALEKNRIFICDLELLENIKCKDDRTLCSPIALFYLTKDEQFMPIAIQLFQQKGQENPVFLPSDPPYTWLLAKMYYNNSDASYHQSLTHLGYTHLMMEGVVVCTHRNMSPSHPLFRLMAPHFLFLLAINTRGLDKLISPGGWVDKTMTVGRDGMFALIVKGFKKWRLDLHGSVIKEIESRKVMDTSVLPKYPYRDDAVPLYHAIRRYVTKIVKHYYDSAEKILEDNELQAWRRELVLPKKEGGVGLNGVPGDDVKGVTSVEQIIDLVTAVISTCSIGHASANFSQYDEYAFPPNYPGILMGEVPKDKHAISEKEFLAHIPSKQITLDSMVITKLLSSKGTKSLGDFEVQYLYDPVSLQAAQELREELDAISKEVTARNKARKISYPWLNPDTVPNSISI